MMFTKTKTPCLWYLKMMPMKLLVLAVPLLGFHSRAPSTRALQRNSFSRSIHRQAKRLPPSFEAQSRPVHVRAHAASSAPTEQPRDDDDDEDDLPSLLEMFSPSSACKVEQMSSTDLAYVGDALYELTVRSWAVWPPKRTSDLQNQVVELVRAEHQSDLLSQLKADPAFGCTATEQQVLMRGRNSVSGTSRNRRNPSAYQDATALEALIGYLFITDRDRCRTLLGWIRNRLDGTGS